jgi:outer membrane autotransporter protein
MKKIVIATILAAAALAASAADVGIRFGRNAGPDTNNAGVTVGQKFGNVGAELAFDRSTVGNNNVNRFSLTGSYDVAKVFGATVSAKAGAAQLNPSVGSTGYAATVGAGLAYPVTKNVSLTADYAFQKGQDRVRAFNGNTVSAGVKYSF